MRSLLVVLVLAASHGVMAQTSDPLGQSPTYSTRKLGSIPDGPLPNQPAMTRRIWAPGIDDGYVPQGLTVIGEAIYLGTYLSTDTTQNRGPCRMYRIDSASGAVTGSLDLPPSCGHAGGLAKGAPGRMWAVDTRVMFEIELAAPGTAGLGRVLRAVAIEAPLKGSFAAGDGAALWLGGYERDKPGKLFRVPLAAITGDTIGARQATVVVEVPPKSQGAAFDGQGHLWVTMSGATFGALVRIDGATGRVDARYALPDGVEDISFDAAGRLWTVSEAGSRRWSGWATHFPVVFQLDVSWLK